MSTSYDYYRVFYHVAKHGSISAAAAALMQGQPNVTKVIRTLEAQLGCKLFLRSNRGVVLTREGEELFKYVSVAVEQLTLGENQMRAREKLTEGMLSVATTEIALHGATLQAMVDFKRDYPGVRIRLSNYTNADALQALKNGSADIAVVTVQENSDQDFRLTTIRNFREILCCKKGYLDTTEKKDADLVTRYTFISLEKRTYNYNLLRSWFADLGVQWEPEIEVSIIDQVLLLVRNGAGIGFLPDILVGDLIEKGEIQEIHLNVLPIQRKICLAENRNRRLSLPAQTFIQYLKQEPKIAVIK